MMLFLIHASESSDLAFTELALESIRDNYLVCVASEQATKKPATSLRKKC